jgi:hypothetical protein
MGECRTSSKVSPETKLAAIKKIIAFKIIYNFMTKLLVCIRMNKLKQTQLFGERSADFMFNTIPQKNLNRKQTGYMRIS